jgi:mTERF domain-containing protein
MRRRDGILLPPDDATGGAYYRDGAARIAIPDGLVARGPSSSTPCRRRNRHNCGRSGIAEEDDDDDDEYRLPAGNAPGAFARLSRIQRLSEKFSAWKGIDSMIFQTSARALCLLGVLFCVDGFILGCSSSMNHVPFYDVGRVQPAAVFRLMRNQLDASDQPGNVIYPTDALVNVGINATQTLVPDIAYFYLRNTIGLSEETMWKVTLESGSILGMTPRNLEKKVSLLRRTMNLSDEDVRIILGRAPTLLHYSAERNLAPTILFLVRSLDLSKGELRTMVLDCPSILSYSLGNLSKKIAFFTALGHNDNGEGRIDSARELLVGTPKLLLSAVDTGLVPRLKFLTQEINFSIEQVRKLCLSNPRLLLYSLDDNLREKIVFFFILTLNLSPEDVRKILLAYPQIMDYNLENHMKPIADYFMTELEFSAAELGSIILKFPRLFSYSLFKIKHVTGFLRYELELDSRQAKRVIFQAPQVLGLAEDSTKAKLDFLRKRLQLSTLELGLILSKMPTLMCLGIQTLASKLDYLEGSVNDRDNKLLKDTILTQPSLLGYSLRLRIQPRMEQLKAAGIPAHKITVGISMTEARFQQWITSSQSKLMMQSIITKRNSSVSGVIYRDLNLNEDELNLILSELPQIDDWTLSSIKLWLAYLKNEFRISSIELKDTLLSHPQLLDGSSRPKLKRRLNMLGSVCSILDNLDTLCLSENDFHGWIGRKKTESASKLSYLTRELALNETESRSLLSEMPSLDTSRANMIFQQRLEYLSAHISDSTEDLKLMILRHPSLLDLSVKRTIEPRMQRLRFAIDTQETPLPNIASLLIMSDNDYHAYLSSRLLQKFLNLTQQDVEFVQLHTRNLLLRDPDDSLLPTLNFLLQSFDGCKTRTATCVLMNPALLDYSLDDWIIPRMKLVLGAGLDPSEINEILSLTSHQLNQILELQTNLNLTYTELDCLLHMKDWSRRCLRGRVQPVIQYLRSLGLSMDDMKKVLLGEPKLLTASLSKKIQPRMKLLLENGCSPADIGKVLLLPQREVVKFCFQSYLSARLCLSSNETRRLFASIQNSRRSLRELHDIVEYLLHNVFRDSEPMLKAAITQDPAILKLSLQQIRPRAEVLHYLESTGLEYDSNDIVGILTQSDSGITKELVPRMKFWGPTVSHTLEEKLGGENIESATQEKNRILATLKDFPQSLAMAYSDEPNKEEIAVVHWR